MARILVIDDDETVLEWLCAVLESSGHDVVTATDGCSGVRAFRLCPADLVITDLIMPGQEGIETICGLREVEPNLPIVAISGGSLHGQGSYLATAAALGATHTLEKPFSTGRLNALVDALLESAAARDADTDTTRE